MLRKFGQCLYPDHRCWPIRTGKAETVSIATVSLRVSEWWSSASLKQEGWWESVKHLVLHFNALAWGIFVSWLRGVSHDTDKLL